MSWPVAAAAGCAAVAAWTATPAPAGDRLLSRLAATPGEGSRRPGVVGVRPRVLAVFVGTALALILAGTALPGPLVGAGAALGGAGLLARRELNAAAARRSATTERACVAEFAAAFAAELRAGRPARVAAAAAARAVPPGAWPARVVSAARGDGDIAAALRRGADTPGAEDLRGVAACWRVAERTGAGLAAGLESAAVAATERDVHRRRVRAELAGVRATGVLLAALPLLGAALGAGIGADPWRVLLTTPVGAAALAGGLALDVLGLAWLRAMTRAVERTA